MEKITVSAKTESLESVLEFIGKILSPFGVDSSKQNRIKIAAEEIFINIASYAYPDSQGEVTVCAGIERGVFTAEFFDEGIPYNPLDKNEPDISLPPEEREIGGLGVFMVKKIMDKVDYRYDYEYGRNVLTVSKIL